MSFTYNHFKHTLGQGDYDLPTEEWRAVLVMTNTTADTEDDVSSVGAFGTLDEFNGSGYTAGGQVLTGVTWAKYAPSDRSILDANDPNWAALGAAARPIAGCLIVQWRGSLASSIPAFFMDGPGFPFTAAGNGLRLTVSAGGLASLS